ncbi:hypothetical protein M3Y97_00024000 [Aphelenchoides bicaudatus]|nr:hypothetical protein M3Y97_00024000 [Aphelenchoides bicaudatus]
MRWTISLEGGPKRVNHAACAIKDKIYSFGGYCSGEVRSNTAPVDVHVLNTRTYRWTRVFGDQPFSKKTKMDRAQDSAENSFSSGFDSDAEADVEFEIENELMEDEPMDDQDEIDQQWIYNPLHGAQEMNMEMSPVEEERFRNVPYMRYGHTVVAYNNKCFLWGGRSDSQGASQRLYEFDPESNTWSSIEVEGFIPPARDGHSAVVYGSLMIVFGGFEEENQRFSQETYAFDFSTHKWTELKCSGTLPQHRDFHAATMLGDKMYVFGGRSDERGQFHSSIDYYDNAMHVLDLKTLAWSTPKVTNSPLGRRSNTLWSFTGKVYMFGGFESQNNKHFADLHCFNPQDNSWVQLKPAGSTCPVPRRRQCSVMVGTKLFLFGGTKPHETKRNSLVDLGDLHILDYENTLFSICVESVVRTGLYRRFNALIPECIQEDIENSITPNILSRVSRTSNSSG